MKSSNSIQHFVPRPGRNTSSSPVTNCSEPSDLMTTNDLDQQEDLSSDSLPTHTLSKTIIRPVPSCSDRAALSSDCLPTHRDQQDPSTDCLCTHQNQQGLSSVCYPLFQINRNCHQTDSSLTEISSFLIKALPPYLLNRSPLLRLFFVIPWS